MVLTSQPIAKHYKQQCTTLLNTKLGRWVWYGERGLRKSSSIRIQIAILIGKSSQTSGVDLKKEVRGKTAENSV
jgi:hypothetical protein